LRPERPWAGIPRAPSAASRPSRRREYVDALAGLVARTRDHPAVAAALNERAHAVVARATGARDLSRATALGLEGPEIGALLHPSPTEEELIDAGRSLARLERAARRRFA